MKNQNRKNTGDEPLKTGRWRTEAISRSNCYGLLALVFKDTPTAEAVVRLRTPSMTEALSSFGYDGAQDLAGEPEAVADRLGEQYTRTFVGPGAHVSLYASVHYGDEGRLWGSSTVWVKQFIEATGLSFKSEWESIPDHIAIELELMQRLTAHEAQLWVPVLSGSAHDAKRSVDKPLMQCIRVQEQFLREHLCAWIPQFCEHVSEMCTSLFYGTMTKLTESLVRSDHDHVVAAQDAIRSRSSACPG